MEPFRTIFNVQSWRVPLRLGVLVLNVICITVAISLTSSGWSAKFAQYDYIGNNFPTKLPIDLEATRMTFHDSIRYPISKNLSDDLWITTFPPGAGYVHLGADYRAFYGGMWHQLHCLQIIYELLENPDDTSFGGEGHLQHCLNYLRQYILCNADDTLEPGDHTLDEDVPFARQCRDWTKMFDYNTENTRRFREFQVLNA